MAKELNINKEECTGCELCVQLCDGVFEMNDDNVAIIKDQNAATADEIQEAIDSCPVSCIDWR